MSIHIPFFIKNNPNEVGNIDKSNEVKILTLQVPLTVHSCIAPIPSTEPSIDKIPLPVFKLLLILSFNSFIRQLLEIAKRKMYRIENSIDQKLVNEVNFLITKR
ncbi:MAG: hypothetical protein PHP08_01710 [Candidatus Dojkabacteria bacterium]|nr:hypothetical protein [Candidatus Dojkabacteria bacterium]